MGKGERGECEVKVRNQTRSSLPKPSLLEKVQIKVGLKAVLVRLYNLKVCVSFYFNSSSHQPPPFFSLFFFFFA